MNVVLIEDEMILAEELEQYIVSLRGGWKVVKTLTSVVAAVKWFSEGHPYNLVFSDIQLGDGLSFSIFEKIDIHYPVIFCTAFDQYAVEAFKNNGIDYILKPLHRDSVEKAIVRYETLKASMNTEQADYRSLSGKINKAKTTAVGSLLVSYKDKIIPVRIDEIALLFIHNGIVCLQDFKENKFTISHTLDELEVIAAENFYRTDRQHLVNRRAIRDVSKYFGRKLLVNLVVGHNEIIAINKEKTSDFLDWLQR